MAVTIIGIDCAAQMKNTAVAIGSYDDGDVYVSYANLHFDESLEEILASLNHDGPALLALDAPLGWPVDLGKSLSSHSAGEKISVHPNDLFRRETDKFIKSRIGKQPLDVGADRIARTAWAANDVLDRLRQLLGTQIGLAWAISDVENVACIEVYPAATLQAMQIRSTGYKGKKMESREARGNILQHLLPALDIDKSLIDKATDSDDVLDAIICLLAGADFLRGRCMEPEDSQLAKREGWIWVREPEVTATT